MKHLFLILSIIGCCYNLSAQLPENIVPQASKDSVMAVKENIKVVSRYRNGVIELRWYPVNAASWRKATVNGYIVERMELNEAANNDFKQAAIVKPFTAEEWRTKTDMNDKMVKSTMESMKAPVPKQGQSFAEMINEENMMFFTYILGTSLSAEAAKASGVMYTDNSIESGKSYAYRISINDSKKIDNNDKALLFITDTRSAYTAPVATDLGAEEGEGYVKLSWNNSSNKENFVAYYIERSADGGRTFTTLNKIPYISVDKDAAVISFTDSVKNYISYRYRIVGVTPFTDKGNPSEMIAAMGRDRTPASPPTNVRARGDRSKILVTWELPVSSRDLKGFIVGRSAKLEGPYAAISDEQKLLSNSIKMFADSKPSPKEPYYAVYSVDTANNLSSTFSVMASVYDSVGPAKPMAVRGSIDSNGVVKLNWKFGNDIDLVGYQIYTANGKENVFRQITGSALIDSMFVDTVSMRSLTEEVYYKITAVDYNNNPSEYSELITLKRPDIIAPAAPVIKDYSINNSKISLTMLPSSSEDVVKYQLIRMDDAGTKTTLAEMRQMTTSYTDTAVKEGMNYSYSIIATDDAGHTSSSKPLRISMQEQEVKEGVGSLTARLNEREKQVTLQWNTASTTPGYSLVLFRSVNDAEMEWYKKLSAGSQTFTEPVDAGKYQYAIKVLYNNGAESTLSRPVSVEVK